MNNRIIYDNYNFDNYKFDISLGESDVKIKICDTLSTDIFECMVNENDTNKHSVFKFCKLLICGLSKEKDFIFQITKIPDKIKCKITYKNDFLDEEYTEVFTANKIEETKIEKLEKQIGKLTAHINKMDNCIDMLVKENAHINKMNNCIDMLIKENNELKEKIKKLDIIQVQEKIGLSTHTFKNFPVYSSKMEINNKTITVIADDLSYGTWINPVNIAVIIEKDRFQPFFHHMELFLNQNIKN